MSDAYSYISEASRLLLKDGFDAKTVNEALALIGRGARVDRVYVFENTLDAKTARLLCSQRFEWVADRIEPQIDNPQLQNFSYSELLPGWEPILARDDVICGLTSTFTPSIRELMQAQDIRSMCICPIWQDGEWWGFVGFDDCHSNRAWPAGELAGLRMLSRALAGALRHTAMRQRMDGARRQLRAILGT